MQETRRKRLEGLIQQELADIVSREVKDPRIPLVTFTAVEVTNDGSQATVFLSILGGSRGGYGEEELSEENAEKRMKDCLKGLNSAAGFLRMHLGRAIKIRHIPNLLFREDRGFDHANHVYSLLREIEPAQENSSSKEEEAKDSGESKDS